VREGAKGPGGDRCVGSAGVLTIQKPDADAEKILELFKAVNVAIGLFSLLFTLVYV